MLGKDLKVLPAHKQPGTFHVNDPSPPISSSSSSSAGGGSGTLYGMFVGNMDYSVDASLLQQFVDDIVGPGLAKTIVISKDPSTGRSRGFAHVNFDSEQTRLEAISKMNGLELKGRVVRCTVALKAIGKSSGDQ